jgi:hypothetical protein
VRWRACRWRSTTSRWSGSRPESLGSWHAEPPGG